MTDFLRRPNEVLQEGSARPAKCLFSSWDFDCCGIAGIACHAQRTERVSFIYILGNEVNNFSCVFPPAWIERYFPSKKPCAVVEPMANGKVAGRVA